MSEESRLGREAIQTGYALQQIIDAGVRVFYYLDDTERRLDSATDKVMMALAGFGSELEREKGRLRTRDAMVGKARKAHVTGGAVYGYDNRREGDHVVRVVNPKEAAIVERIFAELAAGRGFGRIARGLNAAGIAGPRRGWAMTAVREIAFRELYRGRIVYGKTRRVTRGGTSHKVDAPATEWITTAAPELRIVSEAAWAAAHARLAKTRAVYRAGAKPGGRPEAGLESPHLLGGFVACGACGGPMHAIKRKADRVYYVCKGARVDGTCQNKRGLRADALDLALLSAIREVLQPDMIEPIVARAAELWAQAGASAGVDTLAVERDIVKVDRELTRLTDAIASGQPAPALLVAIHKPERPAKPP